MALRQTGWRDIPVINPTRGARYTPGGLGAWRSVVPDGATTRRRSGTRRDGRGRANEYERAIAEKALSEDEGFNLFNAGGRALLGVLEAIDVPASYVRSGIKEVGDIGQIGERFDLGELQSQAARHIAGSEVLGLDDLDLPWSVNAALGFTFDVATDPLTYTPLGAAKAGISAGKPAARKFLSEGAQQTFGEAAVRQAERAGQKFTKAERAAAVVELGKQKAASAATRTLRTPSNQILDPLEREIIGAAPGTFVRAPGINRLVERIAPDRIARNRAGRKIVKVSDRELGAGRLAAKARSKITQSRVGNRMAQGFTKKPELRKAILFGDESDAVKAFHTLEQETAGNLQRRLKDVTWGHRLGETLARARKAGVEGEEITFAAAEDAATPGAHMASIAAKGAAKGDETLLDDLREFMPNIWEDANAIDPNLPWLGFRANYTPRSPSEELIALGRDWGTGGRKFESFDHSRFYGLEDEGLNPDFMGERLLPPAQAKGRSVEQQMKDIAEAKGYKSYFELDAYKSWPDHVRRLAKRYGDEFMAKQLRDLGVLEPNLQAVMRAEGLGWGKRKATMNSMMQKAFAIRDARLARKIAADEQLKEAEVGVQLGKDARAAAQSARREVEAEIGEVRNEVGLRDAIAVRQYAAEAIDGAATLAVRRQALLDNIAIAEDERFVLEHAFVEQAHQLELQTYRNTEKITKLEQSIADWRDELGDIYERTRLMEGAVDFKAARASLEDLAARAEASGDVDKWARYQAILESSDPKPLRDWAQRNRNLGRFGSDLTISRDAVTAMKDAEVRIIELNAKIREAHRILYESEDLAQAPTKHLDRQLQAAELQIRQKTAEIKQPMPNHRRALLTQDLKALNKVRKSVLHERTAIERARARVAELDAQSPGQWVDDVTDLRNIQDLGDRIIHTQFPDLPPDVRGSEVRDYFSDRMGEIQTNIDDTEGQVLSAYADNDTKRAELSVIKQRRGEAERNLQKATKDITPKARALAEEEAGLLAEADEAMQRALDISEAQELAGVRVEGLAQQAQTQEQIEAIADEYLSVMHAKQLKYEAQALKREATDAGAQKTAATWERIAANNFSKEQRAATKTALADQFHEIGKVSLTQDEWLKDAIYGATYMDLGTFHRKFYAPTLNLWKAYALSTPGTVIRNLYGAVFNNYLSPYSVGQADYRKAFTYGVRGAKVPARRETLNAADRELFQQIEEAGLLVGSGTTREIERTIAAEFGGPRLNPFSTEFRPVRFFRRGQEDVEKVVRGALAYRVLKDGGTMDDAIGTVMKYHFDYDDLNRWERSVIRSVVPFYTWTRKNLPLMMEQIVENPQKINRFYQAKNEIEQQSPEEQIIPSYFTENMAIRLPFGGSGGLLGEGQAYMLPDLPLTSINDVTDPTTAISSISPFIKSPIEYAFGKQFFKGIPLKDEYQPVPSWLTAIPGVFPALNAIGRAERGADGNWMVKQKDMYMVESMLPAYGKARRLFPAGDEHSERTLSNWLSFAFGAGVRLNTPQDQRNEAFRRVARELERVETMQELGYLTEADKEPRFGQTVNAAYQYLGVDDER